MCYVFHCYNTNTVQSRKVAAEINGTRCMHNSPLACLGWAQIWREELFINFASKNNVVQLYPWLQIVFIGNTYVLVDSCP